jgi:carbamoyl-phosphate synthase large subunit
MKKKLLLSGLGGSLFPYLHEQLKDKYDLYYVDSDESLVELYRDYHFYPAPLVTSAIYMPFIEELISTHGIEVYIPLIDEEIPLAHEIKRRNPALTLVSPELSFCELALRKDLLMKQLHRLDISHIESCDGREFQWKDQPSVFVKPVSGRGSRGIRHICSEEELKAYYILERIRPENVLIQSYIEGTEYTVGVVSNRFDETIYINSRKILKKRGITIKAVTENNLFIDVVAKKVVQKLKPRGPINIQLFLTPENEVKIFEINPRFSTTTVMSYAGGVDEMGLCLEYQDRHFGQDIIRPKENLVLQRRWESIFYARD